MPPSGTIRGNSLVFLTWSDKPEPQQIKTEFDRWLTDIKQHLQWQQQSFAGFNEELARQVRDVLVDRRDKLLRNQDLVAEIGIPLKRRPGATETMWHRRSGAK